MKALSTEQNMEPLLLTFCPHLCSTAQAWAEHVLSTKTLQHSDTENGENIYYFYSSVPKKLTGKSRHNH